MNDERVYVVLFVDDDLILTKNRTLLENTQQTLQSKSEITVCKLDVFVGMRVERDRKKKAIFVHQTDYAKKLLKRFNMLNAESVNTPIEKGIDLSFMKEYKSDNEDMPYRELIGPLMFLSTI